MNECERCGQQAQFPSEWAALWDLVPGVGWSDHWAFWKEGYPAVMVTDTAPFRYPATIHTPTGPSSFSTNGCRASSPACRLSLWRWQMHHCVTEGER